MEKMMARNSGTKYVNKVGVTEEIQYRNIGIPDDYHCDCEYCTGNYLGEIYCNDQDKYYSQRARNHYYYKDNAQGKADKDNTHICPGHWQGYRFAVQQFSKEGDWIFDPTVGTGTSIIEAINHGRNGVGIELEYPHITRNHIQVQIDNGTAKGKSQVIHGDARQTDKLLTENGYKHGQFSLIMNGTPYPKLGGLSSDAPERGMDPAKKKERLIHYENDASMGLLKGDVYWNIITTMYNDSAKFLCKGGKLVIIIKDMVNQKKAYLLHKYVVDRILEQNPSMKYYGMFMHKHLPATMFMSTYPKMYPEVKIPLYQTAVVLEKV